MHICLNKNRPCKYDSNVALVMNASSYCSPKCLRHFSVEGMLDEPGNSLASDTYTKRDKCSCSKRDSYRCVSQLT